MTTKPEKSVLTTEDAQDLASVLDFCVKNGLDRYDSKNGYWVNSCPVCGAWIGGTLSKHDENCKLDRLSKLATSWGGYF